MAGPKGSKEQIRKRAEADFFWFCVNILGVENIDTKFHRAICQFLQDEETDPRRISVMLAPRGHAKTTIGSSYNPIWCLAKDPHDTFLIVHGIDDTAKRILSTIQEIMETNELLPWVWPHVFYKKPRKEARDWNQSAITVKRSIIDKVSSIQVGGLSGTHAGTHFKKIIGDDLVNDQNYQTPGQLEATKHKVQDQMNLLVGETAKYRFYGTIWNYNDASGWLLNTPDLAGQVRSLILSCWDPDHPDGEVPVWPEVRSKKFLEDQRGILGAQKFAQQYLNQRVPDGTAVFHEQDIKRYDQEWEGDHLMLPGAYDKESPIAYGFYVSSDPNHSINTQADPAVVLVSAVDQSGDVWLIDYRRWWPDPEEFLQQIKTDSMKWHAQATFIEAVGAQAKDEFWLRQDAVMEGLPLNIVAVKRPPIRKFDRICHVLQPFVERGKLHVPRGGKWDVVVDEFVQYSAMSKRDDILDCVTDIVERGNKPMTAMKAPVAKPSQWIIDQMLGQAARNWGPAAQAAAGIPLEGAIY